MLLKTKRQMLAFALRSLAVHGQPHCGGARTVLPRRGCVCSRVGATGHLKPDTLPGLERVAINGSWGRTSTAQSGPPVHASEPRTSPFMPSLQARGMATPTSLPGPNPSPLSVESARFLSGWCAVFITEYRRHRGGTPWSRQRFPRTNRLSELGDEAMPSKQSEAVKRL